MKNVRWRVLLPACQCVLALVLIVLGRTASAAYGRDFRVTGSHSYDLPSWDYVPMTTQIVLGLNFPALIVSSPIEYFNRYTPTIWITAYLICVCGLWYWIGRGIDQCKNVQGIERGRSISQRVACGILAVACGFPACLLIISLLRGHRPVTNLAGLVWSLFGVTYLGRHAIRAGGDHALPN